MAVPVVPDTQEPAYLDRDLEYYETETRLEHWVYGQRVFSTAIGQTVRKVDWLSMLDFISLKIVDSLVIVDILRMTDESTITRATVFLAN